MWEDTINGKTGKLEQPLQGDFHTKNQHVSEVLKLMWSCVASIHPTDTLTRSRDFGADSDYFFALKFCVFCVSRKESCRLLSKRDVYIQNHQFSPRLLAIISAPFVVVVTLLINYSWWWWCLLCCYLCCCYCSFLYMSFVYTVAAKWWKNCCFFLCGIPYWINRCCVLWMLLLLLFSLLRWNCVVLCQPTTFCCLFCCDLLKMKSVWEIFGSILGDALCVATKVKAKSCLASFLRLTVTGCVLFVDWRMWSGWRLRAQR